MKYVISLKEKGIPYYQTIKYNGLKTKEQIIRFFGLDQPEIEDYDITEDKSDD